jgi:hypothetical protein
MCTASVHISSMTTFRQKRKVGYKCPAHLAGALHRCQQSQKNIHLPTPRLLPWIQRWLSLGYDPHWKREVNPSGSPKLSVNLSCTPLKLADSPVNIPLTLAWNTELTSENPHQIQIPQQRKQCTFKWDVSVEQAKTWAPIYA